MKQKIMPCAKTKLKLVQLFDFIFPLQWNQIKRSNVKVLTNSNLLQLIGGAHLVNSTSVDKYQHILFLCTNMKESYLINDTSKRQDDIRLKGVIFDMDGTLIET